METARLFIAVPVSEEVRRAAAALLEKLRASGADFKWVDPLNLHLTLRFLGETPLERLGEIEACLRAAAQRPGFEVTFEGLGAFSSWDEPRVVWVGVDRGAGELSSLAAALGPSVDGKPFRAHLTVGRMRSRRNLDRLKKAAAEGFAPRLQRVDKLVLFESSLRPQGSVYAVRKEQALLA